jgi:predicted dehydrogenase
MKGNIKVGMIRCDLHAVYYAILMEEHNPKILWDHNYGKGGYYYLYQTYNRPYKMSFPKVEGFELVKLWDKNREEAEKMSKIFYGKPTVCKTLEEAIEGVDLVFIADCNGEGEDHLELAKPSIKRGIPTFIDKPFSYDVKGALKLVKLAEKYKTPIMSLSILRELPHVRYFKNRFIEIGNPEFAVIKTGDFFKMAGHIHGISLAQHLFGFGAEAVECMGETPLAFLHIDYGKKEGKPERGVMVCFASGKMWHCGFCVSVYSGNGTIHSPHFSDYDFPWGGIEILKKIKKMVETKQPQVPYEEMIECIAIATAGRLSQKEKRKVYLREVWRNVRKR